MLVGYAFASAFAFATVGKPHHSHSQLAARIPVALSIHVRRRSSPAPRELLILHLLGLLGGGGLRMH